MTQDELARVPEGGARYERGINAMTGNFYVFWGKNEMLECYSESAARQIVGSVNAAIIRNTKCTRDGFFSSKEDMADFNFWLDYAKGK